MQALLTNATLIVFWTFVSLFIFDFINGLFPVPPMPDVADIQLPAGQQESEEPDTRENALLPNPWLCDNVAIAATTATLPVTPMFNRLLLLPPAMDVVNAPIPELNPPITQKRKPGRPKKDSPAPTVAPKRKPGRPKKTA